MELVLLVEAGRKARGNVPGHEAFVTAYLDGMPLFIWWPAAKKLGVIPTSKQTIRGWFAVFGPELKECFKRSRARNCDISKAIASVGIPRVVR